MRTRDVRSSIYLAAGIGLVVALFAATEFFDAALQNVCTVNSYVSCGRVAQSGLTTTLGLPDYLWGILGFVAILLLAGVSERRPADPRLSYALLALTSAGVGLSLYFLYVELAEIHALCLVCVSDYFLGGVAWIGAIALARRVPEEDPEDDPGEEPEP